MVGVDSILELFYAYLKQYKFHFNCSSTLKICGSIIQNDYGRLFTQFIFYNYCSFYSNSISSLKTITMVRI
jgi:hypothetical protein